MQDEEVNQKASTPYSNVTYTDNKLRIKVDFVWSPFISSNMVNNFR